MHHNESAGSLYNAPVKRRIVLASIALGLAIPLSFAASNGTVERLSPGFDAIAPPNVQIERVATGFDKWTEGPVWVHAGYLLFSEIPANNIRKWVPGSKATVFMHPSGYTGTAPFKGPEPGSNGLTLDSHGRLTVAGHARRNIWRLEKMDGHAQITVLADTYEGKRLNSPNDLVYRSDGSLYFTDPPYGLVTQSEKDPARELTFNGVYRIADATSHKPGAPPDHSKLQLLIKDLPRPNGIAFSPDGKYLYVDSSEPRKFWMRYRVRPDGSVFDGKLFFDATSDNRPGAPDGMKVDQKGNVYSAAPGGIYVFSPAGAHLGTFHLAERVGNLAWGDADGKSLYVTASTSIYRIKLKIPGVRP